MRSKPVSLPDVPIGNTIPKVIHQVFLGAELPSVLQRNVEELRAANPGWDHRFYDDDAVERFIAEHYGRAMLGLYRRISPEYGAARADMFRYLALYRCGGVYLDVKSRFTRPIDQVVRGDEEFILSRWRNGPGQVHEGWGLHADLAGIPDGEFQQWHVIAAPGHPFLRAVIERVVAGVRGYGVSRTGVGWIGVLRLTGPIAYTLAIAPLLDRHPCRIVADERELGLEYSVLARSAHQSLSAKHYTLNMSPVVRRPGLLGLKDRAFVTARSIRRSMRARLGEAGDARSR